MQNRSLETIRRCFVTALVVLIGLPLLLLLLCAAPELLFVFSWEPASRKRRRLMVSEAANRPDRELLRASCAPDTPSEILLRPVQGVSTTPPQQLLRASAQQGVGSRE